MSVQAIISASVANGRNDMERKKDVMDLARHGGLITSKMTCGTCVKPMKESKSAKVKDGYRWRCTTCKSEKPIGYESFFQDANLPVPEWLRFIVEWSRHDHATILQLQNSTLARIGDKTAKSMLKSIREFCERIAFENEDEQLGGNGSAVTVVNIGVQCSMGHEIVLYIDDNVEHMVHNHGGIPIKPDSRIHTDMPALPAPAPNNSIVLGLDSCPIADITAKREAAGNWWRLHRGVGCDRAHGVAGEYTVRKKYFRGAVNMRSDIFVDKLRIIYAPLFQNL